MLFEPKECIKCGEDAVNGGNYCEDCFDEEGYRADEIIQQQKDSNLD